MMVFALPWVFAAALVGVLAITALHLLSVHQPPERLLPTARFLPEREVRAVARARRPNDLLLLLVRIALLFAAGAAAAGPVWRAGRGHTVRVAIAGSEIARDTAAMRRLLGAGTRETRTVFGVVDRPRAIDDAAVFPTAWRVVADAIRDDARVDSVELHVLLRTAVDSSDAGWRAWRATWPGRVVVHTVAPEPLATAAAGTSRRVVVREWRSGRGGDGGAGGDDVVAVAMRWHAGALNAGALNAGALNAGALNAGRGAGDAPRIDSVVLVRGEVPAEDADGPVVRGARIRVIWPTQGVPRGWTLTATARRYGAGDSVAAVVAGELAILGPWHVPAVPPRAVDNAAQPIAWWSDGRVAALERRSTSGCVREVAIVPDAASDALLSASARGLFARLLAPCVDPTPVPVAALQRSQVDGGAFASATALRERMADDGALSTRGWIVPVLLALALLLLLVEWRVRARVTARATAGTP